MGTNYAEFQSFSSELISEFGNGKTAKIKYKSSGKTATAKCVILDSVDRGIDGAVHGVQKIAYVVGTLKLAPEPNDILVFGKDQFQVRQVLATKPDGKTTCVYELLVG